ncbi:hypothetical protein [Neomesorhizobium albiziae]|uniref:hypothetical protein n=1 Tax=Neomesorhizobium albiziae TaxID=335020 RepID=UPI00122D0790|nr:hypothetical protein [Mesorhizobium albiziae]
MPMLDIHGAVFRRAFENVKPRALFDLRRAPFFDLTGLGRNDALHIIHSHAGTHLRCAMDLRVKTAPGDRWQLKRQVAEFTHVLAEEISSGPRTAILLFNRSDSVDFFVGLVPPSTGLPFSWQFEGPDARIIRQC